MTGKTGREVPGTSELLERMFKSDNLFSRQRVKGESSGFTYKDLQELAQIVDNENAVRFFDNRSIRVGNVKLPNEHAVKKAVDGVTQAAKFSLLFTKLSGYATPQVVGHMGMTLMGMGLTEHWSSARKPRCGGPG